MELPPGVGPVVFMPAGIDACAMMRMFIPHLHLHPSIFHFCEGPTDLNPISHCRIAVVQRLCSKENMVAIAMMRQAGMKVVYDLDDNMWEVPDYNPAHQYFKTVKEGFRWCSSLASVLTVSTAPLAYAAKTKLVGHKDTRCPPIEVVPNALDFNLYRPIPEHLKLHRPRIRMGWAGTNSHTGDVEKVFGMLGSFLEKNQNLEIAFVGLPPPEEIKDHPRVVQLDWVPIAEYPARLSSWQFDFMIAPLEDNRFNRSKSSLKFQEAGALKIPCIGSDVAPYKDFCRESQLLRETSICKGPKDWHDKINAMIESADLRRQVGEEMYAVAKRNHNIEVVAKKWLSVFQYISQH